MTRTAKRGYIHGYDRVEQQRLIHQAGYLEQAVYPGVDFHRAKHILEVGCGVGAQTKILLRRFAHLKIDAVDVNEDQLRAASRYLKREIADGRVRLIQSDATSLADALGRQRYDGAFLCWFLEHVPAAQNVLIEVQRFLRARAPVFLTEVSNQTLFSSPMSPSLNKVWQLFNQQQITMAGDPYVGLKLGNFLHRARFRKIATEMRSLHFDQRSRPKLRAFADYFENLIFSGAPALMASGRIQKSDLKNLRREFSAIRASPEGVFYLGFVRAYAQK